MNKYTAIGIMSGTSLDGVDLAFSEFRPDNDQWHFRVIYAQTVVYPQEWITKLNNARNLSGYNLTMLDIEYGKLLGETARTFIDKNQINPDIIASHGHTVFHQPEKGITLQIGRGAEIAAITGCKVVCDFRTTDVALGGQGAPLVPIGDRLLFGEFDFTLNLGGFANISYEEDAKRIAFDICPANITLNRIAAEINLAFDEGGKVAASGNIIQPLLDELNNLTYYHLKHPKSLGYEWFEKNFLPVIDRYAISVPDKLRTISEHIALQIAAVTNQVPGKNLLITGGGAMNEFLIERIKAAANPGIVLPEPIIIHFKEALVFALLGVLHVTNTINCLQSVTGASRDSIGGMVIPGKQSEYQIFQPNS